MTEHRNRFLIVTFTWSGEPKLEEVKKLFNSAQDWLKPRGSTVWFLRTNETPLTWFARLRPIINPDQESVFIAELNIAEVNETYSGWEPKTVWDWFHKNQ